MECLIVALMVVGGGLWHDLIGGPIVEGPVVVTSSMSAPERSNDGLFVSLMDDDAMSVQKTERPVTNDPNFGWPVDMQGNPIKGAVAAVGDLEDDPDDSATLPMSMFPASEGPWTFYPPITPEESQRMMNTTYEEWQQQAPPKYAVDRKDQHGNTWLRYDTSQQTQSQRGRQQQRRQSQQGYGGYQGYGNRGGGNCGPNCTSCRR